MEDHSDATRPVVVRYATTWNVYSLAIVMAIDGLFGRWNNGLGHGLYMYIIGLVVISFAFITTVLCSAELTSVLPYSGGTFGFARVTLGPFLGYMVGCCDALRNLASIVRGVWAFSEMLEACIGTHSSLRPVLWLVFFIPSLLLDHFGGDVFWTAMASAAIISLLLVLIYLLAASPHMNFPANVLATERTIPLVPLDGFLSTLRPALNNFSGLLMLPLCCVETIEPKTSVPLSMYRAAFTIFFLALIVAFACCSIAPGPAGIYGDPEPLTAGYSHGLGISHQAALFLSLLPNYATCFCFIYAYSRLLCAMARSRLFSPLLALTNGARQVPYAAQIVGNVLSFGLLLILWYTTEDTIVFSNMAFYGSMVVYASILFSFSIFRWKYTSLNRHFNSPVGIPGAVLAGLVFILPLIHTLGYAEQSILALFIFVAVMACCAIYYNLVACKRQSYSKEEQDIMLVVYIMKSNQLKRKNTRQSKYFQQLQQSNKEDAAQPTAQHLSPIDEAPQESATDSVMEDSAKTSATQARRTSLPGSHSYLGSIYRAIGRSTYRVAVEEEEEVEGPLHRPRATSLDELAHGLVGCSEDSHSGHERVRDFPME